MKKILKYSLTIILLFSFADIFGQSSPYTRIGIGDVYYGYSARKAGMGGIGVSEAPENFISFYNPAGLFNLKRTRIEFNFGYNGAFLSNENSTTYNGNGEFTGFLLGIPVSSAYGIGAVAGLLPYSNIRYDVVDKIQSTDGDYETHYQGRGGLSKLLIGSSYKLPFDLVIGATLDYYFGTIDYNSAISFEDQTNANATYNNEYRPKGLGSTIGAISPDMSAAFGTSGISNFRIGLSYNYISELKTDTVLTSRTTLGTDTITSGIVNMKIPGRFSAGLSFMLNKIFLFNLDYASQQWKNYSFNEVSFNNLRNSSKFSFGFEYKPELKPGATFFQQIIWRGGLSYEQTQYLVNGSGINEYSFSGGFSLPISQANTMDLGLRYAMRGTSGTGLYKENTVKLLVTFSLGDLWFIREEK